jgi:hypothetical protein
VTIGADPPVKRRATDPDKPPIRAHVLLLGERADQPAALSLRQRRIGSVADQCITEQPYLPATVLVHQFSQRSN